MEKELEDKLKTLEEKIDLTFKSAEKTRKYILWTIIIAIVVTVLPLIGLIFVIPVFVNQIGNLY
ncbi:MAG: hypothetical protein COU06_02715 [Candidatus Harrisonbacteria bacterium CG10_big_fil_rev_8_21_14_0_10_38_8]|uniref:Uncharacterized protein n=1 Tax=Candidatus Harrisonbacteria bacterium CG10_big_fil_rev_8_21_14_0_10_38_8 TaxID=1974582 RepID=A0A2M6WJF5_9BACT|nr:MAG: hypothetical protein COU06_02715 [Candidatus Harrisonbacteria bacterium CG10_big_fil_rev_8_21_14_0_10_38_8]